MEQPPNTENKPKNEKNDSTHGEPVSGSSQQSNHAEKQSETTKQNTDDTNSKHNASGVAMGWWRRKWEFVVVPQHANALVAIFSVLLFLATTAYVFFAALQWNEMKKATVTQRQIAKLAYGEPIIRLNAYTGIFHDEQLKKIWATVRIQNDGRTDAKFIRIATRMEFRDVDPPPEYYAFSDKDWNYTEPNYLPPFSIAGQYANSTNDLTKEIPPVHKNRRLYVWGKYKWEDSLSAGEDDLFCRYASQEVFDIFDNRSGPNGGYGGPYIDCKPPKQ
jgi:hypothetical protein